MANIKDFIKKIGNSAVSLEEQQQALAQVEQTIIEAKQKRTEAVGKNADMVIQALKTIEAKLEAKLNELNNTPAKQGVQGPAGQDGKNGKDGKAGRDGINGKDGTDGKDGVDGKDGISVVDAKIDFDGSLVVYLSNGSEIDCGQILQPEVAKNIIISSGGSGTSQVVTDTLVSLQNQINTLTGIDGVLGDMAQQNANAVAITGGTINGTTIGATSATTVNATTITGQTGVLRGTGTNFLTNSASFATTWTNVAGTLTGSQSDPFGGSTAFLLVPTVTNTNHWLFSAGYGIATSPYTLSVYVKASGYNLVYLSDVGNGVYACSYNLSTLAVTPFVGCTGTITAVTGATGWYRITLTTTATINTNSRLAITGYPVGASVNQFGASFAGDGTSGIVIYGAQAEFGSTANTYIPTTTTAVYGTPTLSFSGVSTIGLESNGALFVQPAGTGALQAQATTSTTAGGNARGANAVDWQTARGAASQVASAQLGVIGGGTNNTVTGAIAGVLSGGFNTVSAQYAVVAGGAANNANQYGAGVVAGQSNTAAGYFNFIGGGFTNAGTSGSAVTTQSGTMNATTAVTLSGSNANIKVGQYISGTSIASDTYVAAISGTSLTLSKNASGSSTSTLSFFTPHGVVVGGGNNQATGSYSFIGGGGDAGTAANRNVASGDWATVGGGLTNTASGIYSSVAGGRNSTASAADSHAIGASNAASSTAAIAIGFGNTSNGVSSAVLGASRGNARSIAGNTVFAASNSPTASVTGITQSAVLVLARETTDATPTALASNSSAAGTTNQVILPNNSAYLFKATVISGVTGGGNTSGWKLEGVIKRGANAASTAIVGSVTTTLLAQDAGASGWVIAATADTTNGGLRITFTGQASTTIRTVCKVETTEMTY
jgi:hypothetical protein